MTTPSALERALAKITRLEEIVQAGATTIALLQADVRAKEMTITEQRMEIVELRRPDRSGRVPHRRVAMEQVAELYGLNPRPTGRPS